MIPENHARALLDELLRPVARFMRDTTVSEVLINGPRSVFVERAGQLEPVAAHFESELHLQAFVRAVAQYVGRPCDQEHPVLEGRLPDGSRIEVVLPPIVRHGTHVAIRRFSEASVRASALLESGALSAASAAFLQRVVEARKNVIVAGGTGTGKTSLLNVLSEWIPRGERLVLIEDACELRPRHEHVVRLEARCADAQGRGEVSIRELLRATLRLRPDRILLGEVRDGAALDLLQALSSGHGGSMSTLHATHVIDALHRLETMALMADVGLPASALRAQIASAVDVIVMLERARDGRRLVTHICEVRGLDPQGAFVIEERFARVDGSLLAVRSASEPACSAAAADGLSLRAALGLDDDAGGTSLEGALP